MWGRNNQKPSGNNGWNKRPAPSPIKQEEQVYDTRDAYFDWQEKPIQEPNGDILDMMMKMDRNKI